MTDLKEKECDIMYQPQKHHTTPVKKKHKHTYIIQYIQVCISTKDASPKTKLPKLA